MSKLNPPLKWHGGKHYLANRIIDLMPPHLHYVEAYAGGMSVLLAKDPEGVSEVANDLNHQLTNFWRVLQEPAYFEGFIRKLSATPFSSVEYEDAGQISIEAGSLDRAIAFFIRCRQSMSGRMKGFAPLSRTRTRRGMNEQASAWINAVDGLPAVHARLRRVAILNEPALDVMRQQDGADTLFYLDPPYLHETRATIGEYDHEMSERQHAELLLALDGIKGKFLLSGYHSRLYDNHAGTRGWTVQEFDLPNNAAGGAEKRRMVEVLWCNFQPVAAAKAGAA